MAEISGPVWIAVGLFVGIFSLFLGFITPVATSASFFKLMMFVGLGMVGYGFIKMKIGAKSQEDLIDEARQRTMKRGEMEYEIDMDDYKRNPQLRQQAMQRGAISTSPNMRQAPRYQQNMQYVNKQPTNYQQGMQPGVNGMQGRPMNSQQQNYQAQRPQQPNPSAYQSSQPAHPIQKNRFCHQCGSPLLNHHKFCPICGARV